MQPEKIEISVIVPVYQHWSLIPGLLESMKRQSLGLDQWELILVDNGSDSLPDQGGLPGFVRLLKCEKPGSYAARNMGIANAHGKLMVFTDADCRPCADWLKVHLEFFNRKHGRALQGGGVEVSCLHYDKPNKYELYDIALGLPQERYVKKRGYAVTANLGVPRSVFDDVGFFDEMRFSGGDAEFCQRAISGGYVLEFMPEAKVLHPARSSWAELHTKARRVKGGQVRNGSLLRRAKFILRTYIPPVIAIMRLMKNKKFSFYRKSLVFVLLLRIWVIEMVEVPMLLCGKYPERR